MLSFHLRPHNDICLNQKRIFGDSRQKAHRAFWGEACQGFSVHWCVYTNGHRSPLILASPFTTGS